MQKLYSGRNINLQALAQEINSILLEEGWESSVQPSMMNPQYQDFVIRGLKKGHLHHAEELIVRLTGNPTEFRIIIEEEHIGPLGRELIDRRLIKQIDKEINDGLFDMATLQPSFQQPVQSMPMSTQPTVQPSLQQGGQQIRCPACGALNPPGSKFCSNCGSKLM
ncbi:zinc ribbon domain-containing protein [Acidianus manzaensis]|uniref:Zinc ribbon domain-containing protein n=1 Tax=Acidianus manzaensis TaxID=282676 RepID=A0A1W6K0A7_9CREN|nr:zinc ribbon domain-containing protein [Acidianus manzaensis]ARM75956.1 zinc ribbon domain-containing protein [Acidianus manzaensis]